MKKNWSLAAGTAFALLVGGTSLAEASSGVGEAVSVTGASPFASCTADAGQVGNAFVGTEVEPSLASNPVDRDIMVGAYQQDRWDNGGARGIGVARSSDGGTNWTTGVLPGVTKCGGGPFERATDPWVTIGPSGTVHVISQPFNNVDAKGDDASNGMMASRSLDEGASFGNPATLILDRSPNVLNDKVTATADPDGQHVYVTWGRLEFPNAKAAPRAGERAVGYRGPAWFARSSDDGASWESARQIFDPGEVNQVIGAQVVSLGGGRLLNVFDLIYNFKNAKGVRGYNLAFLTSSDHGATWSSNATIVDKIQLAEVTSPDDGADVRTGDIIPDVAAVPASSANAAKVYAVWQDRRFTGQSQIAFAQSVDGGATWSTPIRVSATPPTATGGNGQSFTPMVEVADDGTVGVTYYDFRNNTGADGMLATDVFYAHCHANCANPASWAEQRVTTTSFDMARAPVARGYFLGDYEGLAPAANGFVSFGSVTTTNDAASVVANRLS